jgi:competence protein ComEC
VLLLIRMPKKFAYILTIVGIFSFAVMSGARPSAMRAAIMLSFLLLSQLLNRKIDLISSLFLSAFIIVFALPGQLFTPGFILSYAAVLSIIYLTPVFDSVIGVPSANVGGHSIDVGGASGPE